MTYDQMEAMTFVTSMAVMNKGIIEQLAKPMDIYRNPKSLFVGKFVGSPPMNVIQVENGGEIVECLVKATKLANNKIKTLGVRSESYAWFLQIKEKSKQSLKLSSQQELIGSLG